MNLSELKTPKGGIKKRKRVGRGEGSGHGKTSCRGHKGQKSRSGGSIPPGFEGGQMPLIRRLPKRGFKNPHRKEYNIVNIKDLSRFSANEIVSEDSLLEKGLVRSIGDGVKVLGEGEIDYPLFLKVKKISTQASAKIEKAGGRIEIIG